MLADPVHLQPLLVAQDAPRNAGFMQGGSRWHSERMRHKLSWQPLPADMNLGFGVVVACSHDIKRVSQGMLWRREGRDSGPTHGDSSRCTQLSSEIPGHLSCPVLCFLLLLGQTTPKASFSGFFCLFSSSEN